MCFLKHVILLVSNFKYLSHVKYNPCKNVILLTRLSSSKLNEVHKIVETVALKKQSSIHENFRALVNVGLHDLICMSFYVEFTKPTHFSS